MAIQGNGTVAMDPYTETLASVPMQARRKSTGDGAEPGGGPVAPPETEPAPQAPTLLDASAQDCFRTIDALCKSQDRLRRNRWAIDSYHSWLDSNIQFGRLDKIPNQNIWIAKLAPGVTGERAAAVPNKASDLCNKVADSLLADPPKPNPQPHVDDETADAAANLAAEVLRQNAGESGINEVAHYRWALRNALTRSCSYLEYDIDQEGGGYQAYQLMAHPQATDQDLAQADAEDEEPLFATDPTSGQRLPAVDPIRRYVSAARTFVVNASEADRVWLPKVVVRRHFRTKVSTFPPTAALEEAAAIVLTDYCDLSEGRKRWPDTVGQMTTEQLNSLTKWTPSFSEMVVPFTFRNGIAEGMTGPSMDEVGSLSPLLQKRMYFHRLMVRDSSEYQSGLLLDITGADGGTLLGRETMEYTVQLPTAGKTTRCRDIPLVQITPNQDVDGLDPTGWPFEARFDGAAQAAAHSLSSYQDALDRMANPHVFIPSMTAIEEDEWADRTKPIIIGQTDKTPYYEQFSPLPPIVAFSEYIETRLDTSSGLTATAQGLDSQNSQSGVAKRLTVRQAQISLAGIQQNLHAGMTRGWRIVCQWVQAKFSTPQLIQFSGEDVSNQEQWWTGEDFAGIDDIGIEPGTGTFMTAEDKANYVAFLQGQQWLDPERAAEIGITGISRDLGLPPDIVMAAIERSVGVWLKGPPEGWVQLWQQYMQQKQVYDQAQAQYQSELQAFQASQQAQAVVDAGPPQLLGPETQNEQAGIQFASARLALASNPAPAVMPQAPQIPPPQKPWTPFEDRPNDTEPDIAHKWMRRLSHLQMSPRYSAQVPEWKQCLDEKYMVFRQATATAAGASPGNPQPSSKAVQGGKPGAIPAKVPGSATQPPSAQAAA